MVIVVHQTFGQFVRVDKGGYIQMPPTNSTTMANSDAAEDNALFPSSSSFNLFGRTIERSDLRISTPERDRRVKRRRLEKALGVNDGDSAEIVDELGDGGENADALDNEWQFVDAKRLEMEKMPECMLNEFPSWDDMIKGG